MPAYSTHYIFAKEMLPALHEIADFELCDEAVIAGTQGPDIFFFHRVFPWMSGKSLRKVGSALHRAKPADILENMREYCNSISEDKATAKSYVYGFILHYALDRRCHPYVYSLQNRMAEKCALTNKHTAHNLIELGMDSYLLNKRMGIERPVMFDTAATLCCNESIISEIGRLYEYVAPRTVGVKLNETAAKTALKDTKTVQAATLDKTGVKRAVVTVLETAMAPFSKNYRFSAMLRPRDLEKAKKYGNIDNGKWISPFDGSAHTESFEELFELAKADALEITRAFQSLGDLGEATHNISFLTGVEVE